MQLVAVHHAPGLPVLGNLGFARSLQAPLPKQPDEVPPKRCACSRSESVISIGTPGSVRNPSSTCVIALKPANMTRDRVSKVLYQIRCDRLRKRCQLVVCDRTRR